MVAHSSKAPKTKEIKYKKGCFDITARNDQITIARHIYEERSKHEIMLRLQPYNYQQLTAILHVVATFPLNS